VLTESATVLSNRLTYRCKRRYALLLLLQVPGQPDRVILACQNR
jgi:hypothetical protein